MNDPSVRILFEDSVSGITIKSGFGTDISLYGNAISVRKAHGDTELSSKKDERAFHVVVFCESQPVGSLMITRHSDGELDCGEFYPPVLVEKHGTELASVCKFRMLPGKHSGFKTFRLVVREVWRELLRLGIRVDAINIERSNSRVFQRMGYSVVPGFDFIHPTLGTDSIVMVLAADPSRESYFKDLFESEIDDPASHDELLKSIDLERQSFGMKGMPDGECSGCVEFLANAASVREYCDAVNHCLSLAVHESLSKRAQLALDIACGSGKSTRVISRFSDRVIGVDRSPEHILAAKSQELGERFEFVESSFEEIQFERESFDLVSASWYLNQFQNEQELRSSIERIVELLKPGGSVAFTIPGITDASGASQAISRDESAGHQATIESQRDSPKAASTCSRNGMTNIVWQPLKLMRILDEWFDIRSWDVKQTLAYERRLEGINVDPPFEVLFGKLRKRGA